ncbi:MAG: GDSL-type esterase/lipase family protein [bacterium]
MRIVFLGDSLTEANAGASYVDILKKRLSGYELINCGKSGDTVVSLYHRLKTLSLEKPIDVAVLWVGVNDVLVNVSRQFRLLKILAHQPWSKDRQEFQKYYNDILRVLCDQSKKVMTVPPLFIGENMRSEWHEELEALSKIIHYTSDKYTSVEYIDLRDVFRQRLSSRKTSDYIPRDAIRVFMDSRILKHPNQMEKKAKERGLYFTVDGVHLNTTGAEVVADVLEERLVKRLSHIQ